MQSRQATDGGRKGEEAQREAEEPVPREDWQHRWSLVEGGVRRISKLHAPHCLQDGSRAHS